MYKNDETEKIKHQERIDRQEKFAEENYAGLDDLGDSMLAKLETIKSMWNDYVTEKDKDKQDDLYNDVIKFGENFNMDNIILSVKLSNTVGHALNAGSTKMIRKVMTFMDTYGINAKPIHEGLMKIASKRSMNGDLIEMALVVAAKYNDLDFTKYIYDFIGKNKNRKNIYDEPGIPNDVEEIGMMDRLSRVRNLERVAFEALINGSDNVYKYITDGQGLKEDYVIKFIQGGNYTLLLSEEEVQNVIQVEPKFVEAILEHMPENLPKSVSDIFLF